jgi:COMPASS component SWD3
MFSPTAAKLATANSDGSVRLWDADGGELLATFFGHGTVVHTVSFNHDGSLLGSGGRDGAVRIWKVE